ncbi:uncharacterized protein EI90DRAFT_1579433 [Cantharellus anzutake]|uniref:uncharacterized protein n=1 Tax=Cantharellus anzutake TaxID=1750568 RepID=UPI001903B1E7|nr:uncharacterized protein EI90DRAFT_1579433 [Cantharellus anzutake]KAF8328456.1 hypothetical protein EI90DRAFT_1579433 [Cantharellus anzutake]
MSASASKIPKKRHDLLESGLACLVCRHRKTKCDGVRPACGRCRRLGKSCEYAEETSRARVRRLEEIIRSLESEIAALRYNNRTSPIHGVEGARAYLGSPSPRLAISPQLERMQEPHIPEAYPRTIPIFPASILYSNIAFASAEQSLSHPGETYPRVITRAEVERALANWDIQVEMPHRLKDYLLRIFLAHRFQFHSGPLAAKVLGGIRSSPSDGGALQVHPSLVHSMCLLACHVGGGSMSSHEAFLVARTRSDLEMSLAFVDRLVDFLLASTLLGVYFTRTRRYPEAYTTLSGAIRLAIACGLQTLTRAQYQSDTVGLLPPPRNDFEMIEQRHAWFALNVADRILTRESGLPSSLPEDALAEIHRSACGISFQNSPANAFQASNSDWIHHWALTGTSLNPGIFDVSREMDHVCLRARLELLFEGIRLLRAYNGGDAETCSAWAQAFHSGKYSTFSKHLSAYIKKRCRH